MKFQYFPEEYEIRPLQTDFIKDASKNLKNRDIYFVNAPCGIGKSLATLVSAIPLIEDGKKLIITYRTRNQLYIYLKELKRVLSKCESRHLVASIISKQEMCPKFFGEKVSYGEVTRLCRTLKINTKRGRSPFCEYYSNLLRDEIMAYEFAKDCCRAYMSPYEIFESARETRICPYEALKLVLPDIDIFLGTYHYLFDPTTREELLNNLETDLSEVIVVVDEAHNLPSFARDLLSGRLYETSFLSAIREAGEFGGDDAREVIRMNKLIHGILQKFAKGLKENEMKRLDPLVFNDAIESEVGKSPLLVAEEILSYSEFVWKERLEREERPYSSNHRVGDFLLAFLSAIGPQYSHWIIRDKKGKTCLELVNMDGREITDKVFKGVHSAILMSGTLSPIEVQRDLVLSEKDRGKLKEFPSPFPSKNRLILVAKNVSSRMKERTKDTFNLWKGYIESVLESNLGNVGIFFPSYELMLHILSLVSTERNWIVEERTTNQDEVIEELSKSDENALFGVMGGKLSEGIDYPGELLTSVVIVGFPYATWNEQQKALIEYMDSVWPGKGRTYAYLTPAILRLLQACGRVHRSKNDRGTIVILDKRAYYPYVRKKLPEYFQREMKVVSDPEKCGELIRAFWNLDHR